jgi:hypothetical protein
MTGNVNESTVGASIFVAVVELGTEDGKGELAWVE